MVSTSYVFSFRGVFFSLVTTGWIFYISFYENSIEISSINRLHRQNSSWDSIGFPNGSIVLDETCCVLLGAVRNFNLQSSGALCLALSGASGALHG